jgi:hypothetical protein
MVANIYSDDWKVFAAMTVVSAGVVSIGEEPGVTTVGVL